MAKHYGAYKHSRSKIKRYRERAFDLRIRVKREPVYVRGTIYGLKVKKEPAYVAIACIGGGRTSKSCATAKAHGPTAAARKAVRALTAKWR